MELQRRIDVLSKDTSITGQQKMKELAEELAEAQERLEELTQDKIDSDFESNIDKEIEKLEDEENSILESLDEKFNEVNIAKMVQQALQTGFIELDGEIKNIQDALMQSINESAQGYSVMSDIIKEQLVANLNIALSTMQELSNVYKNIGLVDYGNLPVLDNVKTVPNYASSGNNKTINIGDTNITVSGNVNDATIEQIEEMIKESQDKMLNEITKNL